MSERVVKVSLTAQVNNYLSGMEQARKKSKELGETSEQLKTRLEAQQRAMGDVGRGMLAMGTVSLAALALTVKKFADFDEAMSAVSAATHESVENMVLLRDAALDAGARTVFSATEAANAIEELGKAGISTRDILSGGLDAALDLAAAGGLGVAEAAGIAAVQLKTFKLEGKDMAHVADLLSAGAGKAMGDVTDLGAALAQSGQVAKSTGLTIDETTGSLAAFAAQGLIGSDAGTSFKAMLQRLTPQSAEAQKKMDALGISAYDAGGNFIGMEKFAGNLQTSLKDLTTEQRNSALATIFGSDAVRAATVLYSEGERGIAKWNDEVNDAGYAAETAALRLDNLKGDLEELGGVLDTAFIKSGSNANDMLRFMAEAATGAVDKYNAMPGPIQAATMALGALGTAGALAGGAFFVGTPKVAAYRDAISHMGEGTQKAAGYVGKMAKGLGAVAVAAAAVAALDAWKTAAENAGTSAADLANALATAKTSKELLEKAFEDKSFLGYGADVDNVTESFGDMIDTVSKAPDMRWMGVLGEGMFALDPVSDQLRNQFEALGDELANLSPTAASITLNRLRDDFKLTDDQMFKLIEMSGGYKDALTKQATEAGLTADKTTILRLALSEAENATSRHESALSDMSAAARDASGDIGTLAGELDDFNASQFSADEAVAAFRQSVLDVQEAMGADGFTGTLNENTQEGLDNAAMLRDLASDTNSAAAKTLALTGEQEDANKILAEGRAKLEEIGGAFGLSGDALTTFIDKYIASPKDLTYQAGVVGLEMAQDQLDRWMANNSQRVLSINVRANLSDLNGSVSGSGRMGTFADGGILGEASRSVMDFYARGGLREDHVAQIAPAGAWRVWAEPETGGEAYIPLAMSKRARSLDIWAETGSRLGVAGYANGYVQPQYVTPRYANSNGGGGATQISLAGATFAATIDGRPITMMIQEQIASADQSNDLTVRMGKQTR